MDVNRATYRISTKGKSSRFSHVEEHLSISERPMAIRTCAIHFGAMFSFLWVYNATFVEAIVPSVYLRIDTSQNGERESHHSQSHINGNELTVETSRVTRANSLIMVWPLEYHRPPGIYSANTATIQLVLCPPTASANGWQMHPHTIRTDTIALSLRMCG